MAWATSSLPVPDSPRISTVASGGGDLRDLLVDVAHLFARADDVSEIVLLLQLALEQGVFVLQLRALLFDQLREPQALRDHRSDDGQQLHRIFVIPVLFVRVGDRKRPDGLAPVFDRHADERLFLIGRALARAV